MKTGTGTYMVHVFKRFRYIRFDLASCVRTIVVAIPLRDIKPNPVELEYLARALCPASQALPRPLVGDQLPGTV